MRRIISFVILLFLAAQGTAAAEAERVIFDNNEYGGVTKEIIYSEDDADSTKYGFSEWCPTLTIMTG